MKKEVTDKWKDITRLWIGRQYCENVMLPKSSHRVNAISIKILFLWKQKILIFIWNQKKSKMILKKNKDGGVAYLISKYIIKLQWFKQYSTGIKTDI
jgi:hypothetical protein